MNNLGQLHITASGLVEIFDPILGIKLGTIEVERIDYTDHFGVKQTRYEMIGRGIQHQIVDEESGTERWAYHNFAAGSATTEKLVK